MYVILGVTGHVGCATANYLLSKNLPVRAVLRNPAKAEQWRALGADVAIAGLQDVQALEAAFRNAEGLFVMTPPLLDSPDPIAEHDKMLSALSTAITRTGPEKLVFLSSIGAHLPTGTGAIKK
ncbi:MAG TPA: NAD(P)H-binding protein, partial [Puia sp.]|nr:NAD(P)H-binding protein [Puia sp.]